MERHEKGQRSYLFSSCDGGGVVSLFCRMKKKKICLSYWFRCGWSIKELITRKLRDLAGQNTSLGFQQIGWISSLQMLLLFRMKYQKEMLKKKFGKDGC